MLRLGPWCVIRHKEVQHYVNDIKKLTAELAQLLHNNAILGAQYNTVMKSMEERTGKKFYPQARKALKKNRLHR